AATTDEGIEDRWADKTESDRFFHQGRRLYHLPALQIDDMKLVAGGHQCLAAGHVDAGSELGIQCAVILDRLLLQIDGDQVTVAGDGIEGVTVEDAALDLAWQLHGSCPGCRKRAALPPGRGLGGGQERRGRPEGGEDNQES